MPFEDDELRSTSRARTRDRSSRGNDPRSGARNSRATRQADGEQRPTRTRSTNRPGTSTQSRQSSRSSNRALSGERPARSTRSDDRDYRARNRSAPSGDRSEANRGRGSSQRRQREYPASGYPFDTNRRSSTRGSNAGSRQAGASWYGRLSDALPDSIPPIFVISLIALVIFLFGVTIVLPNCSRSGNDAKPVQASEESVLTDDEIRAKTKESIKVDANEPHQAKLLELLGEDTTISLLAKATADIDALWIAAHPDKFAFDGLEAQHQALKLAADEDEAIPFVRSYPSSYPMAAPSTDAALALSTSSPVSDVPDTRIPHLYQWDQRWANTEFADTAFGLSGSGPTCLAMVYQGLQGDASKMPLDIAAAAEKAEEAIEEKKGLKAEYLFDGAAELGLECAEMYPSYNTILEALLADKVIVLVVEPGKFATSQTYCVLAGITGNNKAIVNDPNSIANSSKLWDLDNLASIGTTMYVYSV